MDRVIKLLCAKACKMKKKEDKSLGRTDETGQYVTSSPESSLPLSSGTRVTRTLGTSKNDSRIARTTRTEKSTGSFTV